MSYLERRLLALFQIKALKRLKLLTPTVQQLPPLQKLLQNPLELDKPQDVAQLV
jgi:hypothetical protein